MSVRMRHTHSQTRQRRSHHALVAQGLVKDIETGVSRLPHRIDETTGMYNGKQIASPAKAKLEKKHREGTKHEHVHRDEKDEKKPVEATQAASAAKISVTRPRAMGGGAGS